MTTITIVLLATSTFFLGLGLTWIIARAHWTAKLIILQAKHDALQKELDRQTKFFANSETAMREVFGSLAADALHKNNQAFVTLAESKLTEKVTEARVVLEGKEKAIDKIVEPLKESLSKIDDKINALETKREGAYSNISTVLEKMQQSTAELDKGTKNLVSALKTSSTRGKYGEIGLRRVVEFAGMTEHCDFIEQASTASEQGLLIPDMIVYLPEKKTIIVDSKTPLDAYMKVFETNNEAEQQALLAEHARAVRSHLKRLSAKAYWSQFKDSPDYVVLFMQIESSFGAALQVDPELIGEGIRNKVILATPTTLITLLRTVGFVWQQRDIAENIEEIRDAGIELFNRTSILVRHFSQIGGSLKLAVGHYNDAVSSLESRFIPQGKRLHALGAAFTKHTLQEPEQVDVAVRVLDAVEQAEPTQETNPAGSNDTAVV
jgi:DNA recombination protein RmuC